MITQGTQKAIAIPGVSTQNIKLTIKTSRYKLRKATLGSMCCIRQLLLISDAPKNSPKITMTAPSVAIQ